MPNGLPKQSIPLNFSGGVDTKTDPKQVQLGKFIDLQNSIFGKAGLLQKRNGFGQLPSLPDATSTFLTTFNGNLTAIGNRLEALVSGLGKWVDKGQLQPMEMSVLPLIRSNTNQTTCDTAIGSNGLVCTVYTDNLGSTTLYKYAVADSTTGQNVVAPTPIPVSSGAVTGAPKVFMLGRHFIIVFNNVIGGTNNLQYIAVTIANPTAVSANTSISSQYLPSANQAFDGIVANNGLYLAWNASDGGGGVRVGLLDSSLVVHASHLFAGHGATNMSVAADESTSTPVVYATFNDTATNFAYTAAVNQSLNVVLAPTAIGNGDTILNLATYANNGVLTILQEIQNDYPYDDTIPTHFIQTQTVTQAGTVGAISIVVRSLGLASKAFVINGILYFLGLYYSVFQPTLFLMNISGKVVGKFAYENAAPYYSMGLPSVSVNGNVAQISYLYKDLIQAVNKLQGAANAAGVYSQTGINLGTFTIGTSATSSSEIGGTLNLSGGFLWSYDGYSPVENGFFLWPDDVEGTPVGTGGALLPQQYYYVATYEWADNNGNVNRSAPSIPVSVDSSIYNNPPTFNAVFGNGVSTFTVSSTANLIAGQGLIDTTTPSNLDPSTIIAFVNPTTGAINITPATTGASAASPGDMLGAERIPLATTSTFSDAVSQIVVASATGFKVGQYITDATTSGNLAANTYITAINGNTLTLNQPTTGMSAASPGDTIETFSTFSNIIKVPTLRLTYKLANPVKIVLYRWSTSQQTYFQVTSITSPTLNDPTIDYITFIDTQSDLAIQGNNILYTTGGVLENVSPSAISQVTLFDDRLFYISSEDPNLIGYSKQAIEATPVECSDLLTTYVAPSIGAQGSTGPNKCIAPMDDKIILFKPEAILYINGSGPDNTGANSQYSQPIFVNSTVGCSNQNSIVFQPAGLMFQSDKGIWLLGRDLSTVYIGAPVESFTQNAVVKSAISIPGTNQIRFTMDSGITLMYDYFYNQWGTFVNIPAVSSTLYEGLHTYMNAFGQVYQETPNAYLDGTAPVLMSFKTSWINLGNIQGYQRAYFYFLLGEYISPHKLIVSTAYDYEPGPSESKTIAPDNSAAPWGSDPLWGDGASWGNTRSLEQWKVFIARMRCQSFQVQLQEVYDPSIGLPAGAGFTLSGLNLVIGGKKGFLPIRTSRTV